MVIISILAHWENFKGMSMSVPNVKWIIILVGFLMLISTLIVGVKFYIIGHTVLIITTYILIYITKEVEQNLQITFLVLLIFNVLYFILNINNPEVIIVIYYNFIIQFVLVLPFVILCGLLNIKSIQQIISIFIITSPLLYTFIMFIVEHIMDMIVSWWLN